MFDKPMAFWLIQSLNSLSLGGLLFLLSAGFSLIFGLMRIANLSHGAYFMLGAYIGLSAFTRWREFFCGHAAGWPGDCPIGWLDRTTGDTAPVR